MLLKCNAKINLGLSIVSKRDDGFHNLESVFIPVPWYDYIEIKEASELSFTSEGILIDGKSEDNLCLKAFKLLKKEYEIPSVHIHLKKEIPIGAGLGGGSSDAAFVLKGINELFNLGISLDQLEIYADRLGSDCGFFIKNETAFVSGKGEVIDSNIDLKLETYCLLVNPNIHISTKEAYSKIVAKTPKHKLKDVLHLPVEEWRGKIINDFEVALLPDYPELEQLKLSLYKMGASYVSMSGSGSTFFAFFNKKPDEVLFDKNYVWRGFEFL